MITLLVAGAGSPAGPRPPGSLADADAVVATARRVLRTEAGAILDLADRMPDFPRAVQAILAITGRVIVSGVGKSGHIARKVAATLSSTGTPAFFLHPAEASHGDLGASRPPTCAS